ncbi:uncharacterized protein LOC142530602 [Primulina tabacum]|uniref:uncharacterized protein LOC142530602 n=1 Tax=Primulina tabacum TaxID=48773 RepID=UPI003F597727
MISGGSTDGESNRARKSRSRRDCMEVEGIRRNDAVISFGLEDLKGVNLPHSDSLIIQARVANYDILRVFIDSSSYVNVIFKDAFVQMDLQGYHLEAVETAFFSFVGHVVYPEGEIVLPLTLCSQDLKKSVMTSFTVVDSPSSYNIILGRPAMNELRAVASTYHEKIKFPVGARVEEVRGDQPSSRKCYVEAVRADQSKTRREEKKARVDEVGGRVVEKGEVHFVAEEEHETIEELQKAGHIREIQFPTWFSNVVLVPKSTGKWRMCVDFRDLNKACPKDHYPLPRIDQLVDSNSGFELLSFMDAYQGYHQIPLAKGDQDKARFITSGGATYQRLMNRVFEKQLGRNVEVYMGDILGKSREVAHFIVDLEETFATLMRYGIKLNPAKCIFGVKSGKFLGFIVTDREIEAQQFGWDEKCEQAFQDLKIHLAELSVLVKPEPGEKLFVYLSTTEYAVSSVLIKEEGSD